MRFNMHSERSDVVFVVENSCTFKKYLPELMEAYINPTSSHFTGGLSEDTDIYFTQSSLVQFGVVFFGCEMNMITSWAGLDVSLPTTSEKKLLKTIQNATYSSKNSTRQGFILEALSKSVEYFKFLENNRKSEATRKCCILLTQSAPFINSWGNTTLEKTVQQLSMANIKLSIISPNKLPELYQLFEDAGGDMASIISKNYAVKDHHLVFLNGYILKEQAINPPIAPQTGASNTATPPTSTVVPNQMIHPTPSPNPPAVSPSSQQTQQNTTSVGVGMRGVPTSQMNMNPTNTTGGINMNPQGAILRPGVNPGAPHIPPNMNRRWPNNVTGQQPQNVQVQNNQGLQSVQQPPNQSQQPNNPPTNHNPIIINQHPIGRPMFPAPPSNMAQGGQQPRAVVWRGTLEWIDRKDNSPRGTQHHVKCSMSTTLSASGEHEVKTDGWPSSLNVQFIYKDIIRSIGTNYFHNVYTVLFEPEVCPALDVLTTSLSRGMAGCVFLNPSTPSDHKALILLFSNDKKAYVGFIPIDQISFYTKIRDIMQQSQRQQQQQQQSNAANKKVGNNPMVGGPTSSSSQNMPLTSSAGSNSMNPMSSIRNQGPGTNMILNQPRPASNIMGGVHVTSGSVMNQNTSHNILSTQINRPPLTMHQGLQRSQLNNDNLIMRQNPNQQIQMSHQGQRPNMTIGQSGIGGPRMPQNQMQNQGLRQLLANRIPHQQQQQHVMMMQQQGNMRPGMAQGQVLGPQQVLNQPVLNQQSMGQQGLPQDDFNMDLV